MVMTSEGRERTSGGEALYLWEVWMIAPQRGKPQSRKLLSERVIASSTHIAHYFGSLS